jgi:hypothetical protein
MAMASRDLERVFRGLLNILTVCSIVAVIATLGFRYVHPAGSPAATQHVEKKLPRSQSAREIDLSPGQMHLATIAASELRALLAARAVSLIDIRSRNEFSLGHLEHSISLPADELQIRARHEVSGKVPLVVYCRYCAPCESAANVSPQNDMRHQTLCRRGELALKRLGYKNVRFLTDEPEDLERAGLTIVDSYSQATGNTIN